MNIHFSISYSESKQIKIYLRLCCHRPGTGVSLLIAEVII